MRKLSVALAFVTMFIMSTLALQAQNFSVRGRVQEYGAGIPTRPLAGATVMLTPGSRSGVSDATGAYRIEGIPAGTYTVRITAPGHNPYETTLAIDRDMVLNYQLQVSSPSVVAYDLSGIVTESGTFGTRPLAGALVKVAPGGYTATTDANGRYLISDIPSRTYTVTASKSGHRSASRQVTLRTDTDLGLNLPVITSSDDDDDDDSPRRLSGVIRTSDGVALSGATVRLTPGNYTATTNSRGEFTMGNVPNGTYMMHIRAAGYPAMNRKVTVGSDRSINVTMNGSSVSRGDDDDDDGRAHKGKKEKKAKKEKKGNGKGKGRR